MIRLKQILNEAKVIVNYINPIKAVIEKDTSKGKHNVIKITTNNNINRYRIVGGHKLIGYDLNFKLLKKRDNGDLEFHRYIKGGVDIKIIHYNEMADAIIAMGNGETNISPKLGIYFLKI